MEINDLELVYVLDVAPFLLQGIIYTPAVDKILDVIDFKILLRNSNYTFKYYRFKKNKNIEVKRHVLKSAFFMCG